MKIIPFFICLIPFITSTFRIHIIPHSHMDPGWLMSKRDYYSQKVSKIYKSVYNALKSDPKRTFVFAEITYLMMWYENATKEEKETFKNFVQNGRIEIVNGGYVMNDEATPYYQDIIDQMRLGLQIVEREFQTKVETGWSLDPFGHSTANALILNQLGYKQAVYCRLHHQENDYRVNNRKLEFNYLPFKNDWKIYIKEIKNSINKISSLRIGLPKSSYFIKSTFHSANRETMPSYQLCA